MGNCCSKKPTEVVESFSQEVKIVNGVSAPDEVFGSQGQNELLSDEILILGRHERTLRARQFLLYCSHTMQKPTATTEQPWTDDKFPQVFEKDKEGQTIKFRWKRPKDFASDVSLFGNTINRYCVKQGQVRDCFFISTLSAIADHPTYIKQIVPEDAYETDPSKYTGVVHCRFWWMGEWIDVYTDDILPCYDDLDRYVGVHSDDKNVVWMALVEKSLARLYGSYPRISGNQKEVFRLLTGGIVEGFKTSTSNEGDDVLAPDKLYDRIDKALKSGSTVLTNISKEVAESQLKGLVSGHAYSVTGTLLIEHGTKVTKLLRIRNPWGEKEKTGKRVNDGEWKGRWSYTSTEWKEVDETLRNQHNAHIDKGGEFWVCIEDFFKLFEDLNICDRIPHFDRDGFRKDDGLDKVINILGEWHGATSAGSEEKNKMKNPRFILTIPDRQNVKALSVVIEITRQWESPANSKDEKDALLGAIDIYKVEKEEVRDNRLWMSLNKQTFEKSYNECRTSTYVYMLSPGEYLLLPYYYDNRAKKTPVSKSFCIRIFSNVNVACSQLNEYPIAFYGNWNHTFRDNDSSADVLNLFGEWKGKTAAGYKTNKMRNPKFIFTIPDVNCSGQHTTLLLHLRCSQDASRIPNADIEVFKIEKDETLEKRIWRSLQTMPKKTESRFVGNYLFEYELMPGNYLLLPFFYDDEALACEFCVRILSSAQVHHRFPIDNSLLFVRKHENSLEYETRSYKLDKVEIVHGEWVKGLTAGGQICHKSFDKNPQYALSVTGNGKQPVLIALLQEVIEPIHAIGCHIIQIDAGQHLPVSHHVLCKNKRVKDIAGRTHPYMISSEATGRYMLPPGRYLVLVFTDKPTNEKKFTLVIVTQRQSQIIVTLIN